MLKLFKNKSIFAIFSLIFLVNFIFSKSYIMAEAQNTEKVFYLNEHQSIDGTLFTSDELLGPGDKLNKEFYIANNNNFKCTLKSISITGKIYNEKKKLLAKEDTEYQSFIKSSQMNFYCENEIIYSGNVDETLIFSSKDGNSVDLEKNSKKKFKIEYALSKEADSSTMGLEHKFDISFNFSGNDPNIIDKGTDEDIVVIEKGVGGSLVQTGSMVDTKVLLGIGSIILVCGLVFSFKRKRE